VALTRRFVASVVVSAILCAVLVYLRDPPWLISITSGMRPWQTDASGRRLRWTGGHASLFVPADTRLLSIPLRTTFDTAADAPVTVNVTIDDRAADRIVLTDPAWRISSFRLPARGSRRVRRIDIRVDRTRDDNRGVAIGEITAVRTP
jgi:hypothetical protein